MKKTYITPSVRTLTLQSESVIALSMGKTSSDYDESGNKKETGGSEALSNRSIWGSGMWDEEK